MLSSTKIGFYTHLRFRCSGKVPRKWWGALAWSLHWYMLPDGKNVKDIFSCYF